jgi:hypothetical protein
VFHPTTTTTASTPAVIRNDSTATPLDVLDSTRPYWSEVDTFPTDPEIDAAYTDRHGELVADLPTARSKDNPADLPLAPPRKFTAPECGDLVRVNTARVVMAAGHAGFVALHVGQVGKVVGFAEGVTFCEFTGATSQARVVDDSILDVIRRNIDHAASWDFEDEEDRGFVADLNAEGDTTDPTPLDVIGRSAPWDRVSSPAAGHVTFGVLRDGWDVSLADEDEERQDREQTLADIEWEEKALEIDRLYAEASQMSRVSQAAARGAVGAWGGHDLD